jgi:xanthine dehydrogenase accessory factor
VSDALVAYLAAQRRGDAAARAVLLADGPAGLSAGASLTLTPPGGITGSLGSAEADEAALGLLQTMLAEGSPRTATLTLSGGELELFIMVTRPPERLIIVGAVHTAIPLVSFANALGYRTIVIDNRRAFATPERFGHAARLIVRWPADELADLQLLPSDSVVFLTHDERIDNPALALVLDSPVRYVGALGSRSMQRSRNDALREAGVAQEQIDRIHGPIGLDLGGRTPEEIALAIIAEVVQVKHARR